MKKILNYILICFTVLLFVSCKQIEENAATQSEWHRVSYKDNCDCKRLLDYNIIVIDNHQFLLVEDRASNISLVHRPDCKYCKEYKYE